VTGPVTRYMYVGRVTRTKTGRRACALLIRVGVR